MKSSIRHINTSTLHWSHISKVGENDLQYLREHYDFHPLDLEDCLSPAQRPKIDFHPKYIFLVLLFPLYVRHEHKIIPTEINFFISNSLLVTVSDGNSIVLDTFFDHCMKSQVLRERYMHGTCPDLLTTLLLRLQESIYPMLDHVSKDIIEIDTKIFGGYERRMIQTILINKRNIVTFRRVMNAHKRTLKKLMIKGPPLDLSNATISSLGNILEHTKGIWDLLDNQMENITALQETNDALMSLRLNEILKMLTVISVSLLPGGLLLSLFGTNIIAMPFIYNPFGFWILFGLTFISIGIFLIYFKKKRWF